MLMGNYIVDATTVVFRYQVVRSVTKSKSNVMLSQLQHVIMSQHSCDNIIVTFQEIHLPTGTVSTIQSGFKRLLAKANPIHALQIHGELIYAAGSSLDGSVIKVKKFDLVDDPLVLR